MCGFAISAQFLAKHTATMAPVRTQQLNPVPLDGATTDTKTCPGYPGDQDVIENRAWPQLMAISHGKYGYLRLFKAI